MKSLKFLAISAVFAAGAALSAAASAAPQFTLAPQCLSTASPGPAACTSANGGMVGLGGFGALLPAASNFQADVVGHTFRSTLDTINATQFTDDGTVAITSFVDNGTPVGAGTTFLGLAYGMYATFTSGGNYVVVPPSGPDPLTLLGQFTFFNMDLWIDPSLNTAFGDFDNTPTAGTGDDVKVATGSLLSGDAALLFGTQTTGSFSARLLFNPLPASNGFFFAPNPFYVEFQVAGNPQTVTVLPGSTFSPFDITAQLSGGGTAFFLVPEPGTLTLFGAGLIGLAALARRRRSN